MADRQTAERSPERAGMPPEMITAHTGASREIASARLRQGASGSCRICSTKCGTHQRLPSSPRTAALVGGRRRRAGKPRGHDHAERAIRAFAVVVAEKGYARNDR